MADPAPDGELLNESGALSKCRCLTSCLSRPAHPPDRLSDQPFSNASELFPADGVYRFSPHKGGWK